MQFNYQSQARNGSIVEGVIDAPNEKIAIETLQSRGYVVLSIKAERKTLLEFNINQYLSRPNQKDIVIFTRQLATLIEAEMPLSEGLRTLGRQTEKPAFQKILSDIADSVEGGTSLSAALANHPKLFSPFYTKLVRTGELAGKLHEVMNYLADYLERTSTITSKLRGALAYPAFVITAMIIVGTIMMVYVLPELLSLFEESGSTDLPITTKILIAVTNFVSAYILYIALAAAAIGIGLWRYTKTVPGRKWFDRVKLKLPIFGKILRNTYLARTAETFTTLIRSGIAILESIQIVADLVGNDVYQVILLEAQSNVRGGGTISGAFEKSDDIPPLMTSMIAVGEKTGKLDAMMEYVSKFYRSEAESSIEGVSQLIEPAIMLVLGFAVAVMVSAILLPMYNVVSG